MVPIKLIPVLYLITLFILGNSYCQAQNQFRNYGDLKIHEQGEIGFYTNLVNDGMFSENLGLAGFYGTNTLRVSGTFTPVFYDTEISVDNGLSLEIPINVINNANFIHGDILTDKIFEDISINFNQDSFYVGENDISMVDGYAGMNNKSAFTFPVGDDERLRPLSINSMGMNSSVKCAYFYENPNTPSVFGKSFQTQKRASEFLAVSEREFWHLEGDIPSFITLTWDEWSNVSAIAEYISDIKVVGWHREQKTWVNLGNTNVEGGMIYGSVTSDLFIPNDYEIITLGGNDDKLDSFSKINLDNYFLTPNGDGHNDFLVLEGIENSPSNSIQIFNRYGVLVYSKENYENDFNGVSNRNFVIDKGSGLDSGIYFYIIILNDLRQKHQGYMYISFNQ